MEIKVHIPQGLVYEGQAKGLIVSSEAGELGIFDGHLPIFIKLKAGLVKLKMEEGHSFYLAVDGGLAEYESACARILSPYAVVGESIQALEDLLDHDLDLARQQVEESKRDQLAHLRAQIHLYQQIQQVRDSSL